MMPEFKFLGELVPLCCYWLKVVNIVCFDCLSGLGVCAAVLHLTLVTCFILLTIVVSWPSESYLYTMSTVLS